MKNMDSYPTRTLVLLKPDAVERGLVGEILKRFERKGLKIVKAEMVWADENLAKKHYVEHKNNGAYFQKMCNAITCGPVIAVILEGINSVQSARQLIGYSNPISDSQIGTIRADLAIEEAKNLVHGSDSVQAATREITLWFSKNDAKVGAKTTPLQALKDKAGEVNVKPAVTPKKVAVKPPVPAAPPISDGEIAQAKKDLLALILETKSPTAPPKTLLDMAVDADLVPA